jgi:hypothetical protein
VVPIHAAADPVITGAGNGLTVTAFCIAAAEHPVAVIVSVTSTVPAPAVVQVTVIEFVPAPAVTLPPTTTHT